jgi:hypothetical protein
MRAASLSSHGCDTSWKLTNSGEWCRTISNPASAAYGPDKALKLARVLDARRRLDAAGHIHRPRSRDTHGFGDIAWRQATGEYHRLGEIARHRRPIEGLAAAAGLAQAVPVEQQGRRARIVAQALGYRGGATHGDRLEIGPSELGTPGLRFTTVKLQVVRPQAVVDRFDIRCVVVHEQRHHVHEGRQHLADRLRLPERDPALAARGKDHADRIGAQAGREQGVFRPGHATAFDSGPHD